MIPFVTQGEMMKMGELFWHENRIRDFHQMGL
jgi:hypothetical protein